MTKKGLDGEGLKMRARGAKEGRWYKLSITLMK